MSAIPRYAPNVAKAVEVILWIANKHPRFDVYHVVKAAFFADKMHIENFGRPICGDSYVAAPWGPLPQVIYNLLRRDPIELIALESNGDLPFAIDQRYCVVADREPNHRRLSETDIEALEYGVGHVANRSFDDIYRETHADPAYVNAPGAQMDYRDFIPENDENKSAKAEFIEETARIAVF